MTAGGDWLRPIIAGLVAVVVVAVLVALGGETDEDRAGWRRMRPSPMHWIGVILGTGLALLMSYVRLFVGSARADAARQMTILTWLIVAFSLCTVVVALQMYTIRHRAIRWRGSRIVWRQDGQEAEADLDNLSAIRTSWLGYAVLQFADGTVLRIDPYARGARQLLDRAYEELPVDEWGDQP